MAYHRATGTTLSSSTYISIRLREDGVSTRPDMRVVAPGNCNHGSPSGFGKDIDGTACETADCLNSWSLDYQFFLRRTVRGRAIIERFHLTDEQIDMLASPHSRPIYTSHDPFDARYDRVSRRIALP